MICAWVRSSLHDQPLIVPVDWIEADDERQSAEGWIAELEEPDKYTYTGRVLLMNELEQTQTEIRGRVRSREYMLVQGISVQKGKRPECRRCGNHNRRRFATNRCSWCKSNDCLYCRECIGMGKVTRCTPLVAETARPAFPEQQLHWSGALTAMQIKASERMVQSLKGEAHQEQLIWAVCGAGKTEMLFPALIEAVRQQKIILIATPRTDVVLELIPRLKKAFPTLQIAGLYGGSDQRFHSAQLFISTTHQARRFHNYFDVVIVDEVDAFPYSYDSTLAFAVQKSSTRTAHTFYLSATPDKKLTKRLGSTGQIVKVKRRFHGYPLPTPRFSWIGNWKREYEKTKTSRYLLNWISKKDEARRRTLIFVPNRSMAEKLAEFIGRSDITSVHSEDPSRKEIVEQFRRGEYQHLFTTTILERGVTFPSIDVAVFGAEDDIFTTAALVQIAGRAGRSAADPTGDVVFFHYGKTKAMASAVRMIKEMNRS
ncbi:ComF operon protein A, DNA transporter ATPase [Geomicrobium sp. JCM 19037]|uniref:DEAD/DEAH box helicase n=1 Tax=Geomicrobium sp. JCM 19037 TaxID=1460634 RepID=UPI00045F431F|nr:helicase-related protein [Geomicrobium sp. JCM 19037]GAK02588.1 ComF operon protein A, DNA transporter ATPase [Geomicrobium sp. JCM 19037]